MLIYKSVVSFYTFQRNHREEMLITFFFSKILLVARFQSVTSHANLHYMNAWQVKNNKLDYFLAMLVNTAVHKLHVAFY